MTIIERKSEKKPGRGRPRLSWIKQIMLDIGKGSDRKLKVTLVREEWNNISSFNQFTD